MKDHWPTILLLTPFFILGGWDMYQRFDAHFNRLPSDWSSYQWGDKWIQETESYSKNPTGQMDLSLDSTPEIEYPKDFGQTSNHPPEDVN